MQHSQKVNETNNEPEHIDKATRDCDRDFVYLNECIKFGELDLLDFIQI